MLAYPNARMPRTVAFPSKFAITKAWAAAVRGALARTVPDPARLTAEGRADAEPIGGRGSDPARDGRVEIVLTRPVD